MFEIEPPWYYDTIRFFLKKKEEKKLAIITSALSGLGRAVATTLSKQSNGCIYLAIYGKLSLCIQSNERALGLKIVSLNPKAKR
jgi:hypothetical protein